MSHTNAPSRSRPAVVHLPPPGTTCPRCGHGFSRLALPVTVRTSAGTELVVHRTCKWPTETELPA
jgi:hypothetical protein